MNLKLFRHSLPSRAIVWSIIPTTVILIGLALLAFTAASEQLGSDLLAARRSLAALLALLTLGVTVPTLLAAIAVKRLTLPIQRLTCAASAVADGDFEQEITIDRDPEWEALASEFNLMSKTLGALCAGYKERETRLALVVDAIADGIWDWDLASNTVYRSPRWKAMLGYADDEITDSFEDWERLVHPDDLERSRTELQLYLHGGRQIYEGEYRIRCKDSTYRWIVTRGAALRDTDGKPYRMAGSNTDITERKQIEEAMRQSERRFSQAFDASPVPGVILALDDGRYLEVNGAFQRITGFTRAEAIGNTSLGLGLWAAPEQRADFYRALHEHGSVRNEEYLMRTKASETRTVLLSAEVLELNNQSYVLCFISDITEIKQSQLALEKRVAERTHELATLNEISEVVSGSLDLKEILNAALSKAMETMRMDTGTAYSTRGGDDPNEDDVMILAARQGLSAEFSGRVGLPRVRDTVIQRAVEARRPVVGLVADYSDSRAKQALEMEGVRQVINVPLFAKGRLVGVFNLGARHERAMKPEELSLLSSIGHQIAVAVENARLYDSVERSAAIAERQRLSRELHDSVTQSLYSVTMYAEAAARQLAAGDTAIAAEHLRELRDTAQEALREMRLLIFELRPLALEKIGLVAALQARLRSVETRSGAHTELQIDGVPRPDHLPRMVEEELYHIAQEALNNALKHAHADQVRIHLSFSDAETLLEICDDGVGFLANAMASAGGLGWASLNERALKIGARLQIQSLPGGGTQVKVAVPARAAQVMLTEGQGT